MTGFPCISLHFPAQVGDVCRTLGHAQPISLTFTLQQPDLLDSFQPTRSPVQAPAASSAQAFPQTATGMLFGHTSHNWDPTH